MVSVSNKFNSAAIAADRAVSIRLTINGTTVLLTEVIELEVEETMESTDGVSMGCTGSNMLKAKFFAPEQKIAYKRGTVIAEIGVEIEPGEIEYCPLGKYYISEVESNDNYRTISITGYDAFSLLTGEYVPLIDFPTSAQNVIDDIAAQCGITIDANSKLSDLTLDGIYSGRTCRDYIGWIAGLLGCNARFSRAGSLEFAYYKQTSQNITRSLQYMNGLNYTAESETISSLTSGTEENVISTGSGNGISFENPYMTQQLLNAIWEEPCIFQDLVYQPCTVKWRGNPALQCGDVITVEGLNGEKLTIPVMHRRLSIKGGLSDEIDCYAHGEMSFSFEKQPLYKRFNRKLSKIDETIANISGLIGNTKGGIFEIIDSDNDGVNDGFIIADSADPTARTKIIRANYEGIAISTDGGKTFQQAISTAGLIGDALFIKSEGLEENEGADEPIISNLNRMWATLEVTNDIVRSQVGQVSDIQDWIEGDENAEGDNFAKYKSDLDKRFTTLEQSEAEVKISIESEFSRIDEEGVSKVKTSAEGFTFDDEGLHISRSDSDVSTVINEDGMRISKDNDEVLTADNTGVTARNLNANTYLIIGGRSRFENFDKDGKVYSACFWIG